MRLKPKCEFWQVIPTMKQGSGSIIMWERISIAISVTDEKKKRLENLEQTFFL